MDEMNQDEIDNSKGALGAARILRPSDPDTFDNPESARVRARQIGCIGIRRYNNRDGGVSWMPCTNESDYRRVSGFGHSGRQFRRRQLEREVREIIGGQGRRNFSSKSANYTKPQLRETIKKRIMAGSKGGAPGQWSARKAQLVALAYRKAGGGYKGGKTVKQRSLSKWTKQKWRTIDGKPARRGNVVRRYLPAKAWSKLTPAQRLATNRKKIQGSKRGVQFVANTDAAKRARKRSITSAKHAEFYEDYEVKALGGKKIGSGLPGRLGPGSGTGGRAARKLRGSIRGSMDVFDPNPIDADGDNVVQEGGKYERPAPPKTPKVPLTTVRAPQIAKPQDFARPAKMRDGRLSTPASVAISSTRKPGTRQVRRGAPATRRPKIQSAPQAGRRLAESSTAQSVAIRSAGRQPGRTDYPSIANVYSTPKELKENRAEIFAQFTNRESSVQELADKFDVINDEIKQTIRAHKKFREQNVKRFAKNNPRLNSVINKFSNSRDAFQEAIRERKFKDWDTLVPYIFNDSKLRKSKKHIDMQNDLFKAFPSGENPKGKSNITLGYVPNASGPDKPPVKTYSDIRSPRDNFQPLTQITRAPRDMASASDINQRAANRISQRRDALVSDAISSGLSVSGRMASSMTGPEEAAWKKKEWTRQQLKNFSLDPKAKSLYPALVAQIGDVPIIDGIIALDKLSDVQLKNLWDATVSDIATAGGKLPPYQARNAPLSPRELAVAAQVKRPLIDAFIDEYKKFAPGGKLAKIDVSSLSDSDVEDFYNTFILPGLINNGSPTTQEVQAAASLPIVQSKLSSAEEILLSIPLEFRTMEIRLQLAKKQLASLDIDSDSPEFADALQKMLDEQFDLEVAALFGGDKGKEIAIIREPLVPMNPETGELYTEEQLLEQMDAVARNIDMLKEALDPEIENEIRGIQQVAQILAQVWSIETLFDNLSKENKTPPINPKTGQPFTAKDFLIDSEYPLMGIPTNPLTGKEYTLDEMQVHLLNLDERRNLLEVQQGIEAVAKVREQQKLLNELSAAYEKAFPPEIDESSENELGEPEEEPEEEPRDLEEELAKVNQFLEDVKDILTTDDLEAAKFKKEDIKRLRELQQIAEGQMAEKATSAYPDTDEFWNGLTDADGQPFAPYDGDPNHPLNLMAPALDDDDFKLDPTLYRAYLDPNNSQVKEWRDLSNSHTVARYTNVPDEIGGLDDQGAPQNAEWANGLDYFMTYLQNATNLLNPDGTANMAAVMQPGDYGGASFSSSTPDPTVDSSAFQYPARIADALKERINNLKINFLSSSAKSKRERKRLFDLLDVNGLTYEEISFDEEIPDQTIVKTAIGMHIAEANVATNLNQLEQQAQVSFKNTREPAFRKKQTAKEVSDLQELAGLAPGVGGGRGLGSKASADSMIAAIDQKIANLRKYTEDAGRTYDSFRAAAMAMTNMVVGLLQTRPPLRPIIRDSNGNVIQNGWDIKKEPKSRYLNRVVRWDKENIGRRKADGTYVPGIVTQIVRQHKLFQIQTGDDAAASTTTAIIQRGKAQIAELEKFKTEIATLKGQARALGVSGFMKSPGGMLARAEDISRAAGRQAAFGRFNFADPRILKRFDQAGFPVTRSMLGSASGFNPKFSNLVSDATKQNNYNMADWPGFALLSPPYREIAKKTDWMIRNAAPKTSQTKSPRSVVGSLARSGQSAAKRMLSRGKTKNTARKANSFNPKEYAQANKQNRIPMNISGRMSGGDLMFSEMLTERMPDGKWYVVSGAGAQLIDSGYKTQNDAAEAMYKLRERAQKTKSRSDILGTLPEREARRKGIDIGRYRLLRHEIDNAVEVGPIDRRGKVQKFIFNSNLGPKKQAADLLVMRKNAETGAPEVLVIKRVHGPHNTDESLVLPGGFFDAEKDSSLTETALREAREETGFDPSQMLRLEKLGTIDEPDWDVRFPQGIEVSAALVEVPSTWEWKPRAADDARNAFFVPLEDIANGKYALGFGHAAWFDAAFSASEDESILPFAEKFSVLNALSRERNQRIIARLNQSFTAWNDGIPTRNMTLDDGVENDFEARRLKTWGELPNPTGGFQTFGPETDARIAVAREKLSKIIDALREKNKKDYKSPPPQGPRNPGQVSGNMRSPMEMDVDQYLSLLSENTRKQVKDDVAFLRNNGFSARSISRDLGILYSSVGSKSNKNENIAPTDNLVAQIIQELKNDKLIKRKPNDRYEKKSFDEMHDISQIASNGLTIQQMSDIMDISPERTRSYLESLGFDVKDGEDDDAAIEMGRRQIRRSETDKQLYADSVYGRMTLSEISKKYKIPESQVLESIDNHRRVAENSPDVINNVYRAALNNGGDRLLDRDELDGLRMRLDGLSSKQISGILDISEDRVFVNETSALAKLRSLDFDGFYEMDKERAYRKLRSAPFTEYIDELPKGIALAGASPPSAPPDDPNDPFKNNKFKNNKADLKKFADSRDLRVFRSFAKDAFMRNQYLGESVESIAKATNKSEKEVQKAINLQAKAVNNSDTLREKLFRRNVTSAANKLFTNEDLAFLNMRNDGASLKDVGRYLGLTEDVARAYQMELMSRLNLNKGISGSMNSLPDLDSRNLYHDMGLSETSSVEDINNSFLELMRNTKPRDINNQVVKASEAYAILSRPDLKNLYDSGDMEPMDFPEEWENYNSWDRYFDSYFGQNRHSSFKKSLNRDPLTSRDSIRMPHDTGSDVISDDLDDGFLGFEDNDDFINDMYYRNPVPGTPEWRRLKQQGEIAKASGDPRYRFDENGFVTGKTMDFMPEFDKFEAMDYASNVSGRMSNPSDNPQITEEEIQEALDLFDADIKRIEDRDKSNSFINQPFGTIPFDGKEKDYDVVIEALNKIDENNLSMALKELLFSINDVNTKLLVNKKFREDLKNRTADISPENMGWATERVEGNIDRLSASRDRKINLFLSSVSGSMSDGNSNEITISEILESLVSDDQELWDYVQGKLGRYIQDDPNADQRLTGEQTIAAVTDSGAKQFFTIADMPEGEAKQLKIADYLKRIEENIEGITLSKQIIKDNWMNTNEYYLELWQRDVDRRNTENLYYRTQLTAAGIKTGISGSMKGLVPEGSWSIDLSQKKKFRKKP